MDAFATITSITATLPEWLARKKPNKYIGLEGGYPVDTSPLSRLDRLTAGDLDALRIHPAVVLRKQ